VRGRRLLVAGAVLASVLTVGVTTSAQQTPEQACDQPTHRMNLYAEQLPDSPDGKIRLGWGLTPDTAQIPGPPIELIEGECLAVTVTNDIPAATLATLRDDPRLGCGPGCTLPLGVSLHVHGVKYTTNSDGTIHTNSFVPPRELGPNIRTFKWYAAPRVEVAGRIVSMGTAGYWWYHDHVIGTDHGTGGLASGLFGGVVVRRPGDFHPNHTFTVVMGPNQSINLRHYKDEDGDGLPDTDACDASNPVPSDTCFVAKQGDRVEFIVFGVGDDFHTFHLHGHNWADNRTGILASQLDETALIDAKTVGPSESFGFQVIAGDAVGTGKWMMHCHVQGHSDAGMVTFFNVLPGSAIPAQGVPVLQQPHVHYGR
jgi:FtsP/CotA-like multicopper oxidase with cupredoxin domain